MAQAKWVSRRGNAVNEDHAWGSEGAGYVLDGASGLYKVKVTPDESDAAWFTKRAGAFLEQELSAGSDRPLADVLRDCCAACMDEYRGFLGDSVFDEAILPSASLALYRCRESALEVFLLGDCHILVELHGGAVLHIQDESVPVLDNGVVAFMKKQSEAKGLPLPLVKPDALGLLRENRRLKNTEGGYWTFDPKGVGVSRGSYLTLDIREVRSLALLSDGFDFALVFPGLYKGPRDLLRAMETGSLEDVAAGVHHALEADENYVRFPRLKLKDDASAVWWKG